MTVVVPLLYIVAFALFILGLSGLTGPRTAVRGNKIAALGMLVAVLATLLTVRHNWLLILVGLVIGAALGVPSARRVRMTAMPQMVALFNGVGGGAVALIAWSEFRTTDAFAGEPLYVVIASLFGAIVGSVSFWGSLVAFGKLQEILPGRPTRTGPCAAGGRTCCCWPGPRPVRRRRRSAARSRGWSGCSSSPRCSASWSCCPSVAPTCPW